MKIETIQECLAFVIDLEEDNEFKRVQVYTSGGNEFVGEILNIYDAVDDAVEQKYLQIKEKKTNGEETHAFVDFEDISAISITMNEIK